MIVMDLQKDIVEKKTKLERYNRMLVKATEEVKRLRAKSDTKV